MGGLGAPDFMLGADNFVAALGYLRDGALQLGLQLGDFEHGEGLALMDAVADVDVDVADEAGDLGMNIDDLIGLELTGQGEHLVDVADLHESDLAAGGPGAASTVAVR